MESPTPETADDSKEASPEMEQPSEAPVDGESDESSQEHLREEEEDVQMDTEVSHAAKADVPAFIAGSGSMTDTESESTTLQAPMDSTEDIVERYEMERQEHIQLMERIQAFLKQARKEKEDLLQLTLEMTGVSSEEAAKGTWTFRHRQQLLTKMLCARHLVDAADCRKSAADITAGTGLRNSTQDEQPSIRPTTPPASDRSTPQRRFTKKAFPEWLMHDEPVVATCVMEERKRAKPLHPLRDMALKVEWKEGKKDAFVLSWVPKKPKAATSSQALKETSVKPEPTAADTTSQTTVTETASEKSSSSSSCSIKAKLSKSDASSSSAEEKKEIEGVDALMGLLEMNVISGASKDPVPVVEATPLTLMPTTNAVLTSPQQEPPPTTDETPEAQPDAPAEIFPIPSMPQVADTAPAEMRSLFAVPQETPQILSFFQTSPQVASSFQASSIAGGAAFGQSAFPRSGFGQGSMSSVAPQLGSLGGGGNGGQGGMFNSGGFASFSGGGFAAFAKQATSFPAPTNQQQPSGNFSTVFGQTSSPPAPTSFGGGSFGPNTSGSSLFGSKPLPGNDKLWEMRK